jgi:hypothetical protein
MVRLGRRLPSTRRHTAARRRAIALMLSVDAAATMNFKHKSEDKMQMFNPQRTSERTTIQFSGYPSLNGWRLITALPKPSRPSALPKS